MADVKRVDDDGEPLSDFGGHDMDRRGSEEASHGDM